MKNYDFQKKSFISTFARSPVPNSSKSCSSSSTVLNLWFILVLICLAGQSSHELVNAEHSAYVRVRSQRCQ